MDTTMNKYYQNGNGKYNGQDYEKTIGTAMENTIKRQWKLQLKQLYKRQWQLERKQAIKKTMQTTMDKTIKKTMETTMGKL